MPAKPVASADAEIARLNQALDTVRAQGDEWHNRARDLKDQMVQQQARTNQADQEAAALATQVTNLEREVQDLRHAMQILRDLLAEVAAAEVVGTEYVTIHLPQRLWAALGAPSGRSR